MKGIRRPHFAIGSSLAGEEASGISGTAVAPTLSSYVAHWRRKLDLKKDDPNSPLLDSADDGESDRPSTNNGGDAIDPVDNAAGGGKNNADEPMEKCVALLAPHLAAFREKCLTAPDIVAGEKDGGTASAGDEVPPQLLRVARFFRWRWGPLKRALLRPAEASSASSNNAGEDGDNVDGAVVEVGSAHLRLRLARALHSRGLLSLAEVDELAASLDRVGRDDDDGTDASPFKKRKLDTDGGLADNSGGLLTARIRLALSRLSSDVNSSGDSSGMGSGVRSDKARRGIRYAETILAEWAKERQKGNENGGGKNVDVVSSDCPSPQDVADWCLTAFTAVVLANGIDYKKCLGSKQYQQGAEAHSKVDESDVELSLASVMLNQTSDLGLAIDGKIRAFMSPQLIDDLNEIHLLSLARLLCRARQLRHHDLVVDYFAESAILCSCQSGGVGMKHLPKIIASYLSLVVDAPGESIPIPAFEASLRAAVKRVQKDDAKCANVADERRALLFCDVMFHAVRFLLSY